MYSHLARNNFNIKCVKGKNPSISASWSKPPNDLDVIFLGAAAPKMGYEMRFELIFCSDISHLLQCAPTHLRDFIVCYETLL